MVVQVLTRSITNNYSRRVPIARQPTLQITPRAIELFEAMEQAKRRRNSADCINDHSGSGDGSRKPNHTHCNAGTWTYRRTDR